MDMITDDNEPASVYKLCLFGYISSNLKPIKVPTPIIANI